MKKVIKVVFWKIIAVLAWIVELHRGCARARARQARAAQRRQLETDIAELNRQIHTWNQRRADIVKRLPPGGMVPSTLLPQLRHSENTIEAVTSQLAGLTQRLAQLNGKESC